MKQRVAIVPIDGKLANFATTTTTTKAVVTAEWSVIL